MSTYMLNYQLREKTHRRVLSEQNAFDLVGKLTRFLIKHSIGTHNRQSRRLSMTKISGICVNTIYSQGNG